ncbi:FtsX-like permease family protein [Catenulispora subtropica]|uniref:ABC3 transporter permease C-terminal domain-containing protein n=1 Tax=Catenulispora subtropica TaxID=450798 RepID=A0ABN2RRA9_9ACTN
MWTLTFSNLRHNRAMYLATFLNLYLGGAILTAFASLYESGSAPGVSKADRDTLQTMALVIGGWGALIIAFGTAATLSLAVRQRERQIALLKAAGALPGQIRRMIMVETAALLAASAIPATPTGMALGRAVTAALKSSHQVSHGVGHRFGATALSIGFGDIVLAAGGAAVVAGRRAANQSTAAALVTSATDDAGLGRKRVIWAVVLLGLGVNAAVMVATMMKDEGYDAMSVAGQACILTALGLAVLAPVLIRATAAVLGPLMRGTGGYLAEAELRQHSRQAAGVLMPVILFVALANGALYQQFIQDDANRAAHLTPTADDKGVQTLSFLVVGMIALFAAVVVANLAVAGTLHRRREFGQRRLIGDTPGEVRRSLGWEAAVVLVAGLVSGTLAALVGILPFSYARTGDWLPDQGIGVFLGVTAVVVALTMAACLGAARRALRTPALAAVGA